MVGRWLMLGVLVLAGCATLTQDTLLARFGPADASRLDQAPVAAAGSVSYRRDVKPILDQRCVVCHGCYDAPCQLKLSSWEGIARGSSKDSVYGMRLLEAPTTRLGIDAQRASQWRGMGFDAVLNERTPTPGNHLAASVLWRSLALKQAHPLPATPVLDGRFDFALDRAQSCPSLAEFDAYESAQAHAGMPYGLPGLSAAEMDTIARWLRAGAPDDAQPPLPALVAHQVAEWEAFLNGPSLKERLMSRYLYEHLFLGHLVFEGDAQRHVFRLVRSVTPPGQPVQALSTRRPYDEPGVASFHYRLMRDDETLLAKTHMPMTLSRERLARWRGWFIEPAYTVAAMPSYDRDQASNPFTTFAAIPLPSRYRFLLDEAAYFVMNFIKGPVCRGQTALDVINDRFWVFFTDPAVGADAAAAQMVAREGEVLRMPAAQGSNAEMLAWLQVAASEDRLLAAKSEAMNQRFGGRKHIDLSAIWHGDGHNPNAALTIFRHFDSASVVKGLVGEPPKTAWVIGYPLLERIYYLLVAGYDVWGNTPHQLQTRLYMDFLRMEGEANFLMLLPRDQREALRNHWYRGATPDVTERVLGSKFRFNGETGIAYEPGEAQPQLYRMLQRHLAPVLPTRFDLQREPDAPVRQALQQLASVRGDSLQWWPETVLLRVDAPLHAPNQAPRYYTVLRNTGHFNVATLLRESAALAPSEQTLTVVPGFIGAYPNALMRSTVAELPALAQRMATLAGEADYRALVDRHGIRRTDPGFWAASDALMQAYRQWAPAEAGLLDYGRLQNR
jgi:hypothetical protein